jgi:hypothetical protein
MFIKLCSKFWSSDKKTRGIFSFFSIPPHPPKKKPVTCTYTTENEMLVNILENINVYIQMR